MDPWVPRLRCLKDYAKDIWLSTDNAKVSRIINNRGDWDEDLIHALIQPIAVNEILKIRLESNQHQDRWV